MNQWIKNRLKFALGVKSFSFIKAISCMVLLAMINNIPVLADCPNTWTSNAPTTKPLYGAAFGAGLYVVGGDTSTLLTSSDAINWTTRSLSIAINVRGIIWANNQFVAVGNGSAVYTSPNGITWTARSLGTSYPLASVTWSGSQYVAVGAQVGNRATILTSPNGINWTYRPINAYYNLYGVTYGNGLFVAVGDGIAADESLPAKVITSPNGINWTERYTGLSQLIVNFSVVSTGFSSVNWNGSKFVAVGYEERVSTVGWSRGSRVLVSTNGINWSLTGQPGTGIDAIDWDGNQYLIGIDSYLYGDYGAIYTSFDANTWQESKPPEQNRRHYAITHGNNKWVVAGKNGYIYTNNCTPQPYYTLTVTKQGTGAGTVTGTGINCGSDCNETYNTGTNVTLTATAASGSTFAGWNNACTGTTNTCSITMNGARTATATFTALPSVVIGPIANPANNHNYYLLSASSWADAEAKAVTLGGHLTTINDAAENTWVGNTFLDDAFSLWIGLTDRVQEGTFVWVNGETSTYRNWYSGEPNDAGGQEDFVQIWSSARWNDVNNVGGGDAGRVYGVVEVVPAVMKPTVTTNAATNITATSATLNGRVSGNGATATVSFAYGLTTSYGSNKAATPSTVYGSNVAVSANVTGLTSCKTYHFTTKATNSVGTSTLQNKTFTTTCQGTDFIITGITLSPTTPAVNSTFNATITVKNQGTIAGDGKFLDVWPNQAAMQVCGATGAKRQAVGSVAAGGSKTLTFTGLAAGTAGAKTLRAFVDSGCGTVEGNEGNNQLAKTYFVGAPTSCLAIKKNNPSTTSGTYLIDPDGAGSVAAFQAYCDMTTDGGGYTYYAVTGGITTYKVTDDNTCKHLGMDIVYPRTKAHINAMYTKYGFSYFNVVPGVYGTVPGNYSSCIMRDSNSYGSGCSNWRVADGGKWWLRDTTWGEPNGDYTAGCWLSAWRISAAGEVDLNDWNCEAYTSTYICSTNDKP